MLDPAGGGRGRKGEMLDPADLPVPKPAPPRGHVPSPPSVAASPPYVPGPPLPPPPPSRECCALQRELLPSHLNVHSLQPPRPFFPPHPTWTGTAPSPPRCCARFRSA